MIAQGAMAFNSSCLAIADPDRVPQILVTLNRFRVFYDIDPTQHVVAVLAIGIKRGNRLLIGGEEIRL
jgi:hypothetical protein